MLKCAHERVFYEKDAMLSNIFVREAHRQQHTEQNSERKGVEIEAVVIDVPTGSSMPYYGTALKKFMKLPVSSRS